MTSVKSDPSVPRQDDALTQGAGSTHDAVPEQGSGGGTTINTQFASVRLPSFDGRSSVQRFLDDFNRFGRLQGWSDEKKLDVFPLCLVGIARDAFESLSAEQQSTFEEATSGLKASFSSRSSVDHHVALRALQFDPTGSLDAFVIEFKRLVALAFPGQSSQGLLYNHFLSAIPHDLCSAIIADGISTFEGAVTKVRNLCSAARHGRQGSGSEAASVRKLAGSVDDSVLARLERRIAELEAKVGSTAGPSRRASECFACGDAGHFRSQCRHKNETCSKCNRRGHLPRVCGRYQGNWQGFSRGATGEPAPSQRP